MEIDTDRIDEAVLALLYLGLHDRYRAWKGFDWAAMDRLHKKGFISDPVSKAKSVAFTEEGLCEAERLFRRAAVPPSGCSAERLFRALFAACRSADQGDPEGGTSRISG
jgi:hypothetical protein